MDAAMAVRSTVSGVTSGVLDCGLEALPDGEPEAPAADGEPAAVDAALDAMPLALLASSARATTVVHIDNVGACEAKVSSRAAVSAGREGVGCSMFVSLFSAARLCIHIPTWGVYPPQRRRPRSAQTAHAIMWSQLPGSRASTTGQG